MRESKARRLNQADRVRVAEQCSDGSFWGGVPGRGFLLITFDFLIFRTRNVWDSLITYQFYERNSIRLQRVVLPSQNIYIAWYTASHIKVLAGGAGNRLLSRSGFPVAFSAPLLILYQDIPATYFGCGRRLRFANRASPAIPCSPPALLVHLVQPVVSGFLDVRPEFPDTFNLL